jgi:flagellum-specific peptidoglycan hydrolase FlgJ
MKKTIEVIENFIRKYHIEKYLFTVSLSLLCILIILILFEPKLIKTQNNEIFFGDDSVLIADTNEASSTPKKEETPNETSETSLEQKFIDEIMAIAKEEEKKYGIPAKIKVAQAIVESGWGRDEIAKEYNNFFGIKHKPDFSDEELKYVTGKIVKPTSEFKSGRKVNIKAEFAAYKNRWASMRHHSLFLRSRIDGEFNKYYSRLKDIPMSDYKKWAITLQKAGYSTNPDYANSLIRIIEKYL